MIRGVAKVCGARGKIQNAPPSFQFPLFLRKGWPLENLRVGKWQAKKKRGGNFTFNTSLHVQIDFIRPIFYFALAMLSGWSYIFYTWHDLAPPRSGARGKCPPLPSPSYPTGDDGHYCDVLPSGINLSLVEGSQLLHPLITYCLQISCVMTMCSK